MAESAAANRLASSRDAARSARKLSTRRCSLAIASPLKSLLVLRAEAALEAAAIAAVGLKRVKAMAAAEMGQCEPRVGWV